MTAAACGTSRERVERALNLVHDPCSVAAGHPLGLVDMGLVTRIVTDGSRVEVTLRATFAGCMMMPHLTQAAECAIGAIPGVEDVEIDIDMAMTWTPADMMPRPQPLPGSRSQAALTLEPIGGSAMKGA